MQRISLNAEDFQKLVRGEIVGQGDLQVSLQKIDYEKMYSAFSEVIAAAPFFNREYWLRLKEGDRQLLILALAETALLRPGFDDALRRISQRVDNPIDSMYDALKGYNSDRVTPAMARIPFMFLNEDAEELRRWIHGINQHDPTRPGDFLLAFAAAVCRADASNYPILRSAVIELQAKFPKYRFAGVL
jgi:hypothetical protein